MALDRATRKAIARYGPTVNHLARSRYGISGQQLLARLTLGESGGDKNAVSGAGAKGRTQFMPGSRAEAMKRFGIDPWGSADDAEHAAALHLLGKINGSKGLEGYNPGDPSYAKYILNQKAPGDLSRGRGVGGSSGTGTTTTTQPGQSGPLDVGSGSALTALLQSQLSQPARPGSTTVPTPPSFAAGPTLARDAIQTTAPEPKKPDLSATLSAVKSLTGADLPASPKAAQTGATGSSAPAAKGAPKGVVKFDGKPVRSDFAKELAWARAHGWNGTVISGFRTKSEQMAAAKRYGLQHYGPNGPLGSNHVVGHRGAVDVTDPEQLNKILGRYPGKRTLIWGGPVIGDRPHFSPTGH